MPISTLQCNSKERRLMQLISTSNVRSEIVTHILNGAVTSIRNVIPIKFQMTKPQTVKQSVNLDYGVLIGFTGDISGKMIFSAQRNVFGTIGENMYGMALEGEMLASFSGELGNMIAGGISTKVIDNGYKTDITSPTIMEGDTTITGYNQALQVPVTLENVGNLHIYLLLD